MKRKTAPGIIDVARLAGVSTATVSRFFNSPDLVRADTRHSIEKATVELGYIRDRMAGAMHGRFSGTIGMIVPTINNAIFSGLIEAFSTRLLAHDRTLVIACHNYDLALEASIIRSLLERRIDGLALVGQDHEPEAIELVNRRDVPMVALWGHQKKATVPFVGADNALAASKAAQHLLDLGHIDIAFIFPDTSNNDRARERKSGALTTMKAAGITVPESRVITCPYDIAQSKRISIALLDSDLPTAIVCGNDIIAQGVIYAALEIGLKLPDELSIVGIGDFAGSAEINPGLTTVRLPATDIGELGADKLVEMITAHNLTTFDNQLLESELVIRDSTQKIHSANLQ